MASLEWRIIAEILRKDNMAKAQKMGLNDEHFLNGDARQVFKYLDQHYRSTSTFKQLPTQTDLRRRYPTFQMPRFSEAEDRLGEAMESMIVELKSVVLGRDLRALLNEVEYLVTANDPEKALDLMRSHLGRISHRHDESSGAGIDTLVDTALRTYDGAKSGELMGIPWFWDCLTKDTMGKKPGNFCLIYARNKSFKTWMMLVNAVTDYLIHKRRVFIWSREMQESEMALRIAAILSKVDAWVMEKGLLPPPVEERFRDSLNEARAWLSDGTEEQRRYRARRGKNDLIVLAGRGVTRDFQTLKAKIMDLEPEIVYLDSYYHLKGIKGRDDHTVQRGLTEEVKQMALDLDTPVVATTQANREGEKKYETTTTDIGRTDAAGAEADILLRLFRVRTYEMSDEKFKEDDYEGYWENLIHENQEDMREKRKYKKPLRLNPNRGVPPNLRTASQEQVREAMNRFDQMPKRKSADVAVMVSGSRNGLLDGFLVHCLPGYKFDVVDDNLSTNKLKALIKEANELERREEAGEHYGPEEGEEQEAQPRPRPRTAAAKAKARRDPHILRDKKAMRKKVDQQLARFA